MCAASGARRRVFLSDARGYPAERKFCAVEFKRRLGTLTIEKWETVVVYSVHGSFLAMRPPFLRCGEYLGNYATHHGIYFRIVSRTLKLRLCAVFHLFQALPIFSYANSNTHEQERDNKLFFILIFYCCMYMQKDIVLNFLT